MSSEKPKTRLNCCQIFLSDLSRLLTVRCNVAIIVIVVTEMNSVFDSTPRKKLLCKYPCQSTVHFTNDLLSPLALFVSVLCIILGVDLNHRLINGVLLCTAEAFRITIIITTSSQCVQLQNCAKLVHQFHQGVPTYRSET
jgi:hypothetical protein